jgi:hypothetical protein
MVVELDTGGDGRIASKSFFDDGKFRSEVEPAGLVLVVNAKSVNKGALLLLKAQTYLKDSNRCPN